MKKLSTTIIWLTVTPTLLVVAIIAAYYLKRSNQPILLTPKIPTQTKTVSSSDSIFSQVKGVMSNVQTGDARPVIIAEFLKTHQSPLEPYDHFGQVLTDIADRHQLDFRLLPSIMMQESNLCKKIPSDSYNCLGLGIHSKGTWTFTSYEENFEAAAKVLRENYLDQGYLTPDEIQNKYTPSSNGSWEFAVNHFMDTLETAEFIK